MATQYTEEFKKNTVTHWKEHPELGIKMKWKLLSKFVLSLGILGTILTVVISFFSYNNSKAYLEEMYVERVIVNCKAIASMISIEDVKTIIAEDGENSEAYVRTVELLNKLKQDGDITFLSLVVPDEDSVTFYIDAMVEEMGDDPSAQIPYGSDILYVDAAMDEADLRNYEIIWEQYSQNKGIEKPLITDNDYGYNYTGVAPILDENRQAIAEIQYILDMNDVRVHLNSVLFTMLLISCIIIGFFMILYIFYVKRMVTTPLGKLVDFTKYITDTGIFENQRIEIKTGDEIEALSISFNSMLEELENYISNLSKITAEKERISAELNVATNIQLSMLPCIFPAFPERTEFDIYAKLAVAREMGGSFYDFFLVDQKHLAVMTGEIQGRGIPAALLMVITKTLIKNYAQLGYSPGRVFMETNNQLSDSNEGMTATAFLGIIDLVSGEFTYVNAGHSVPLFKHAGGEFDWLSAEDGFVLGSMEGVPYWQQSVQLAQGDLLFLYTKGLVEAEDSAQVQYSSEHMQMRLNQAVKEAYDLKEIVKTMEQDVEMFQEGAQRQQDIVMMLFRYLGM